MSERLLRRRTELQLSREQLAATVGISDRSIVNYESGGREPTATVLMKIAKALNTTVAYLIGEVDDPSMDALRAITEEEAMGLGYRARAKEWDELIPSDEMELALQELAVLRRIRLLKEAERQKGSTDITGGKPEP